MSPSTVSRAWRRFQETGSYSERHGQDCRRSLTHQQYRYMLLCARKNRMSTARALQNDLQHWCECLWPNDQKQTSWVTSYSGPCAHCPAPRSSIDICHWTPELAGLPLAPCAFHREQPHVARVWRQFLEGEGIYIIQLWTLCFGPSDATRLHLRLSRSSVMPWSRSGRKQQDTAHCLIRSMPWRFQACIQARGEHTNYWVPISVAERTFILNVLCFCIQPFVGWSFSFPSNDVASFRS